MILMIYDDNYDDGYDDNYELRCTGLLKNKKISAR